MLTPHQLQEEWTLHELALGGGRDTKWTGYMDVAVVLLSLGLDAKPQWAKNKRLPLHGNFAEEGRLSLNF